MERRDAIKSLAALAGATGMSVTPVMAKDVEKVTLVMMKVKGYINDGTVHRLTDTWTRAVEGTDLEGVKVVVFTSDIDVEFVRG